MFIAHERADNCDGRLVCPLYARFVAKHRAGDFSKSKSSISLCLWRLCQQSESDVCLSPTDPQKHIRMTEQEVEDRISSLFK